MTSAAAMPLPEHGQPVAADRLPGKSVLYISLDGITDPLGGSQILPYLVRLSRFGHRITLLSLEKSGPFASRGDKVRNEAQAAGIRWVPLPYREKPPVLSKIWNSRTLGRRARQLQRETGFDLVHCRSYIPASIGLQLRRDFGVPFLFDMRGFFADERKEGGGWPQTNPLFRLLYRYFKTLEASLFREAAHVISLTHEGKRQLHRLTDGRLNDRNVTIIPCCVDFDHFPLITPDARTGARTELGLPAEARVVAYLGSIGSWYMLDEMFDFFRVYRARHPGARFLFVSPSGEQQIRAAAARHDVDDDAIVVRSATRDDVPWLMAAADLGLFFIRPVFSKSASSPTKMAELIALGLPIVTNGRVGDVSELVTQTGCGVAIDEFTGKAYADALVRLEKLGWDPSKVRDSAEPIFDVDLGAQRYDACYRQIAR